MLLIPGHPLLGTLDKSFIVALDISKAFDRIWHKALLDKLPAYGFTRSFCKLISGYLSNRFISVVVDTATCASFPVSSGVPQGSYLSPTLFFFFSLFINIIFMSLPLMFIPLLMIQPYRKLLPSSASLRIMLALNLILLCLQLLTQICRTFPSGELII